MLKLKPLLRNNVMFSWQRSAAQWCGLVPVHLPVGQLESIRHCTALHCPCSTAALNQCVCAAVSTARDHRAVPFHSVPAACGSECGSPLCCRTARPRHAAESIHRERPVRRCQYESWLAVHRPKPSAGVHAATCRVLGNYEGRSYVRQQGEHGSRTTVGACQLRH